MKELDLYFIIGTIEAIVKIDIKKHTREEEYVACRYIGMELSRIHTTYSPKFIGKKFGKDRATVIHSRERVKNYTENPKYNGRYKEIYDLCNLMIKKKIDSEKGNDININEELSAIDKIHSLEKKVLGLEFLVQQKENEVKEMKLEIQEYEQNNPLKNVIRQLHPNDLPDLLNKLKPFVLMRKKARQQRAEFDRQRNSKKQLSI